MPDQIQLRYGAVVAFAHRGTDPAGATPKKRDAAAGRHPRIPPAVARTSNQRQSWRLVKVSTTGKSASCGLASLFSTGADVTHKKVTVLLAR